MAVQIIARSKDLAKMRAWLGEVDLLNAFPAIAAAGESVTRARLQRGGPDPDSIPWQRLGIKYAASKHWGKGILTQTGALRDSIVSGATKNTAFWGSASIYARIHQFGGIIRPKAGGVLAFMIGGTSVFAKKVTIPKRPFLGFGPEEEKVAVYALADYLEKSVNKYFPNATVIT